MKIGYHYNIEFDERRNILEEKRKRRAKHDFVVTLLNEFIPDPTVRQRDDGTKFIDERYYIFSEETMNIILNRLSLAHDGAPRYSADFISTVMEMLSDHSKL